MIALEASGAEKLGEKLARRIESSILSGKNRTGQRLGTEEDISAAFGVSRWVMREALAIMEMDGLIEIRRGKSGGLYVSVPAAALRVATLRHYFCLSGASGTQINTIRAIIEEQAAFRAMRRITPEDIIRLREICRRPRGETVVDISATNNELFREILTIADHPALTTFSLALAQANIDRALWLGASDELLRDLSAATCSARIAQIEAIIAHDEMAAIDCQLRISEAGIALHEQCASPPDDVETAVVRASRLVKTFGIDEGQRIAKKPEAVARLIAQRTSDSQFDTEGRIGSETELLSLLKVSRNVLREAVRMLERYGIVRVQRGVDGGLRAIRPDPVSVIRATSLYLAPSYSKAAKSFHRISLALQLEAARVITARDAESLQRDLKTYRATLMNNPARSTREEVFSYYDFLARACGNPVLECLMRSLVFQVDFAVDRLNEEDLSALRRLQLQLADAVESRDASLTRRLAIQLRSAGFALRPVTRESLKMLDVG